MDFPEKVFKPPQISIKRFKSAHILIMPTYVISLLLSVIIIINDS